MPGAPEQLIASILGRNRMQKNFLAASLRSMSAADAAMFDWYLDYCLTRGLALEFLAEAYDLFVRDTVKEQLYFSRCKRYRYGSLTEVQDRVYLQPEYMRKYMYGLALSSFLWPNHREMNRFFESSLPRGKRGAYLEVGPGHGFLFMRAMRVTSYDSYEAVDLSPTSVELTETLIGRQSFDSPKEYRVHVADFLEMEADRQYDAIVLGEVLEHVETPARFLHQVAAVSHAESYIYLSTCLNAPEIDHISLFSNIDQLRVMIRTAGLAIRRELLVPYPGVSLDEAASHDLPVNIAFELRRQ